MRKLIFALGTVSLMLVSGVAAQAQTVKERCTANRCVYYQAGKGRVATAKKDAAGRTVIRTGGKRIVVKREGRDGNRLRFRVSEER